MNGSEPSPGGRKAMPYFVQDQSFINFDNDAIKISVKDAKYTHYELGTVLLFNKFWFYNLHSFPKIFRALFNFENRAPEMNNHNSPTYSGL